MRTISTNTEPTHVGQSEAKLPREPFGPPEAGPLAWSLGALLVVALVTSLWFTRRLRHLALTASRAPHAVALRRLRDLRERPLKDRIAMHADAIEATDIIRHYIEQRFDVHAPRMTTEEFLELADIPHRDKLQIFLVHGDLVKFARHEPDATARSRWLEHAESFVQETSP